MTKRGKHANFQVMARDRSIRDSLPETKLYSIPQLFAMLTRYRTVILKPNFGSGGAGVIKMTRSHGGKFTIQFETRTRVMSKAATFAYLKRFTAAKSYIIQRYIPLAQINGRPFDLRVMVQRKQGVPWTVTGKLVKVAGPNQFITNVARSRGYVLPAVQALSKRFSKARSAAIMRKSERVSLHAARQLGEAYGRQVLGFDLGIDPTGRVWVLEANPKPAIGFFRKLKDRKDYRRIIAMAPSRKYRRHFTGPI